MILEANVGKKIDEQILSLDKSGHGTAKGGITYLLVPIKDELLRLRGSALLIRQRKIRKLIAFEDKLYDDELRARKKCILKYN